MREYIFRNNTLINLSRVHYQCFLNTEKQDRRVSLDMTRTVSFSHSTSDLPPSPVIVPPKQNRRGKLNSGNVLSGKRAKTIVVPQVPNRLRNQRTPRVAKREIVEDSFDYSMARVHPQTPNVQIVAQLSPLVQRCLQFSDYDIVLDGSIPVHPPIPAVTKKLETLANIFRIVDDPVSRRSLPQSSIEELFEMIKLHIFHDIPAFKPPNEFSEIVATYVVKNWEHIEIVHMILQTLMKDQSTFCHLIDKEFTFKLVRQLDTPVFEEQQEIEKDLKIILESYVGYRTHILHCMLTKLIAYLDGVKYLSWSVGPILRLFLSYFNSLSGPVKQSNFLLFRTVFYPLFSTELAYHFEAPLHDLALFFQARDPATALWCLQYLKNHWPRTSTRKQILFLHQITIFLPTLPATMFDKVGPLVLQVLTPYITSEHWQVSLNATLFCADDSFIDVYKPIPDAIEKYLIPAAKVLLGHWREDERELAGMFLEKLNAFRTASKPAMRANAAPRRVHRESEAVQWAKIVELASANADIDTNKCLEQIHNTFSQ